MRKNKQYLIALFFVLLPLLFLNVRPDTDWGDDFAQYLTQSQNFCQGKKMMESGYLHELSPALSGPAAYPPLFPILISPVHANSKNDFKNMNRYMAFWLVLASMIIFIYFQRFRSGFEAFIVAFLFTYHPFAFSFKNEILPDFTFIFFTFLTLIAFHSKPHKGKLLIVALLTALTFSIRSQGIVLALVIPIAYLINQKKEAIRAVRIRECLYHCLYFITLTLIINALVFNTPLFSSAYTSLINPEIILQNLVIYYDAIAYYLSFNYFGYPILRAIFVATLLVLMVRGIIAAWKYNKISVLYFITFLLMLLNYNYTEMSIRYSLPLIPFIFFFIFIGLKKVSSHVLRSNKITTAFLVLIFFAAGIRYYAKDFKYANDFKSGPLSVESQHFFKNIKEKSQKNAVIMFFKPRAMYYFTGRSSFYTNSVIPQKYIMQEFRNINLYALEINTEVVKSDCAKVANW